MSALISAVSSVVTSAISWLTSFAGLFTATTTVGSDTVLAHPILLVPICLTVAGFGVGILKRLMSVQ